MAKMILPALLALTLLTLPAQADQFMGLGIGTKTCGEFVKGSPFVKKLYLIWLEGFITGVNSLSVGNQRLAGKDSHPDASTLWLEKYCKANPLDAFVEAAAALQNELAKRER